MSGQRVSKHVVLVDDAEAERADFVVCSTTDGRRASYPDAIDAVCADCGLAVFHHPSVPETPPKVCVTCACRRVGVEAVH